MKRKGQSVNMHYIFDFLLCLQPTQQGSGEISPAATNYTSPRQKNISCISSRFRTQLGFSTFFTVVKSTRNSKPVPLNNRVFFGPGQPGRNRKMQKNQNMSTNARDVIVYQATKGHLLTEQRHLRRKSQRPRYSWWIELTKLISEK